MRLVKLDGHEGPVFVNPEHVVSVRKAVRDTKVDTVSGMFTVHGEPSQIARILGAEELQIEIPSSKMIEAQ